MTIAERSCLEGAHVVLGDVLHEQGREKGALSDRAAAWPPPALRSMLYSGCRRRRGLQEETQ